MSETLSGLKCSDLDCSTPGAAEKRPTLNSQRSTLN